MFKCTLALVLCCAATVANANLIHEDWRSAGDSLVTVDTHSGLEWLNFSQATIGHDQIRAELTTNYSGFRFATASELLELFSYYVPDLPSNGFWFGANPSDAAALQSVIDALGFDDDTFKFINTCEYATGCDALPFGGGNGLRRHILSVDLSTSQYGVFFNDDVDFTQVQALVRVPEPGSLELTIAGLAGLLACAHKRRRRSKLQYSSSPLTNQIRNLGR